VRRLRPRQNLRESNLEEHIVSGRYEGGMVFPTAGSHLLDLRIDIDKRYNNSPIMNRISGDVYRIHDIVDSDINHRSSRSRIYLESWIVDTPIVERLASSKIEISGNVRFWKGNHAPTFISIVISFASSQIIAEVTFTDTAGITSKYSCMRKSDCFRDLVLEVDICNSVNTEPILPMYDTHWDMMHPSDLPRKVLTIEECYREAGVHLSINPQRSIIDDSAANFNTWSDDELHDAMETYYSQYSGIWPTWQMWCSLCGKYDKDTVLGVMFDADSRFGGAGQRPERQGFAVFRKHRIFDDLMSGTPVNQRTAYAMRQYLRTFVHEAGHALNLLHSWNKDRPSSLSWMNYPQHYPYGPNDPRNNANEYWNNFKFRFDEEELIHIRHGDRSSVIMGGDPWSSGRHLEDLYPFNIFEWQGRQSHIEFLLRSKGYFEYLEPIEIELRIRNLLNIPVNIDSLLNPEYDRVTIFIEDPNGKIKRYNPIIYKESEQVTKTLQPSDSNLEGADRYSENVVITYGKDGFYFDHPGEYLIKAIYQGFGNIVVPSNTIRLRIGNPLSDEEDNIAYDFFTYQVGMNLYLKGSQSPFLSNGKRLLEYTLDLDHETARSAKISYILASAEARPFFRIEGRILKQTHKPNYEKALKVTEPAINFYSKKKQKAFNIQYHNVVRTRVNALLKMNRTNKAKEELRELRNNLIGVNEIILKEIEKEEKSIHTTK
jgi:hypothetical protein